MKIEELTNKIMESEKELESLSLSGNKNLAYFAKKYVDLLELRELDYNIREYGSNVDVSR